MLEIENILVKNVSYLHARDPSILTWNRCLDEVRVNLAKELLNDKTKEESSKELVEACNLQVFLRIKDGIPFENLYDIDGDHLICKVPEGSHALRNIKDGETMTKTYSFTKIFGPSTKQIQIFNDIVKAKMLGFINGKNSTLLTYGASGSGKTFTIVGTAEEPGLIPRALEYVFRTIPQLQEAPKAIPLPNGEVVKYTDGDISRMEKTQKSAILNATLIDRTVHIKTYKQMQQRLSSEPVAEIDDLSHLSVSIWVSFAEIYNENIYDLLMTPPQRGKQRPRLRLGNSKDGCFIKNLTSIHVCSGIEAYQVLQFGLHNLKYAATSVNSHSSRSHCIFTIKLIQVSKVEEGVYVNTFNFCDLAGSERVKKTMNVGDRLKESNNINTSLLVLGRCINNIRSTQQLKDNRLIPFRESKLTQLFQKALMGLEDIMMIVNINPSRDMFDESQHVLNFSAVAKEILVEEQPKIVKPKKKNRFSQYMEQRTGSVAPISQIEEEDEKDFEINRLKIIVTDMYTQIEHMKREFDIEQKAEREHIISCYKEIMNELAADKDKIIEELKADYKELEDLNNHYRRLLTTKQNVISVESSSDEEESPSKKKSKKDLHKIVSELTDKLTSLQREFHDLKFEKERLERELQVVPKLKEQVKVLTEEETNSKIMLKEAEEAYSELQAEIQEENNKNKKLVSENLQLKERVEYLEEQLLSFSSSS